MRFSSVLLMPMYNTVLPLFASTYTYYVMRVYVRSLDFARDDSAGGAV